jgi:hypothetical protein
MADEPSTFASLDEDVSSAADTSSAHAAVDSVAADAAAGSHSAAASSSHATAAAAPSSAAANSAAVVSAFTAQTRRRVLMGTCGWNDASILKCGRFYPASVRTAVDRLRHYAAHFPVVKYSLHRLTGRKKNEGVNERQSEAREVYYDVCLEVVRFFVVAGFNFVGAACAERVHSVAATRLEELGWSVVSVGRIRRVVGELYRSSYHLLRRDAVRRQARLMVFVARALSVASPAA